MVIDEFVVAIGASTSAFDKAIGGLLGKLGELDISAAKIGGTLAGAAVVGAAAVVTLTKKAIDYQESIYGASKATGVSAEKLSVLAYAGRQSGVSIESLQAVLARLSYQATQAAGGSAEAQAKFAAFGISVRDSGGQIKTSDQLLREMSAQMAATGGTAGRTGDVIALLGRGGAKNMELLGTNFQQAAEEARQFGVIVSDEAAARADEFNDSLVKLKEPLMGLGIFIANDVVPRLNTFIGKIIEVEKNTSIFSDVAAGAIFAFKGLSSAAIIVVTAFQQAGQAIGATFASLSLAMSGDFKGALGALKGGFADIGATGATARATIEDLWKTAEVAATKKKSLAKSSRDVAAAFSDEGKSADTVVTKTNSTKKATEDLTDAQDDLFSAKDMADKWAAAIKKASDSVEDSMTEARADMQNLSRTYMKMVDDSKTPSEQYEENVSNMLRAWEVFGNNGPIIVDQILAQQSKLLGGTQARLGDSGVKRTFLDLDNTWSNFKTSFSNAVVDIITQGGSFKEKMSAIFEEIGNTILRTIVAAITETVAQYVWMKMILGQPVTFGGIAGNVFGGMPGGGMTGGMGNVALAGSLGSTFGGNMAAGLAAGQAGGFSAAGQLAGSAPWSTTGGAFLGAAAPYAAGIGGGLLVNQLINNGEDTRTAALLGAAGTFFGGPLVGAAASALADPVAKAGDFFADIFGWADGGIVTKPSLGWVAEAGQPEAIIPLDRLDEFVGGGGGGSQTIIINLDGRQIARVTAEHLPGVLRMNGVAV